MTKTKCLRCKAAEVEEDARLCEGCLADLLSARLQEPLTICPICESPIIGIKTTQYGRLTLNDDWEVLVADEPEQPIWSVSCEKGHSVANMIIHLLDPGHSTPP